MSQTLHRSHGTASPSAPDPEQDAPAGSTVRAPRADRRQRRRFLAFAGACYLVLAVVLWWRAWSAGPTSHTLCACGDPGLFLWFIEWPAYALSHGLNPLYSGALFHPEGVNLLSNTSELALGVVLAPVTWLFGPVATVNVAGTLAPVLSALAMCWLLLRWVRWRPAAFVGGLLYGFSPFLLVALAGGHLMLSWLCIPPLVVACLDELLVRRRRSPYVLGIALALLLTVQFFLSTELLVMMLMVGAVGGVLLLVSACARDGGGTVAHLPYIGRGLGTAAVATALFLAYPTWFVLAGPAHLSGPIWMGALPVALGGNAVRDFWSFGLATATLAPSRYAGPTLPQPATLGVGLFVVLVAGWALFRRDWKLSFFWLLGLVAAALSLGYVLAYWTPWRLFASLPQLENVIPSRFSIIVDLCAAVLLGLIVDHVWSASTQWSLRRTGTGGGPGGAEPSVTGGSATSRVANPATGHRGQHAPASRRWLGALAGITTAAVALVPLAVLESAYVPLTLRPAVVPRWFETTATRLPPGQVVLSYPTGSEATMAWQAIDRMHFALAEGGGPEGVPQRAGRQQQAVALLAQASAYLGAGPAATPAVTAKLRGALVAWGVTVVVVPRQPGLPLYDRSRSVEYATALFTATIGVAPSVQDGALVWDGVQQVLRHTPSRPLSVTAFDRCGTAPSGPGAARCVLAAPH